MTLKDPCSCCGLVEADGQISDLSAHTEPAYSGLGGSRIASACWYACLDTKVFGDRIRDRRASLAESPRFYMTRPAVLPETLPAGTRSMRLPLDTVYEATDVIELAALESAYYGKARLADCLSIPALCRFCAKDIDWSTVPVQEAHPPRTIREIARAMYNEAMPGFVPMRDIEIQMTFTTETACRDCKSPATHGVFCAYCHARENPKRLSETETFRAKLRNTQSACRMTMADIKAVPRATADARELAKPHPWEEFE